MFVRDDATTRETQRAFSIPLPTSSCNSEPSLSQGQQDMVLFFSIQSGMKPQWFQKCLQDNKWKYTRAAQVFTMLKMKGMISEEAFKQIS
ncbi:nuclear RNA export factor 2-like [Phyllostomus discolor]|uniref:Nuclear RNA export factor 2-like n=1 Tax=Phyllostomus discolor TaxID=89673 RepID=A0A7E6CZP0_9CHIR|nr:nuclear RNA export factor 2-like [Phyllostomus discolor]